ncbi:MAG: serine protein kinase RIO [Candidatus Altiarchaeota archaeon]
MKEDDLYRQIDLSGLKTEEQRAPSRKISEAVFDNETLKSLYDLAKKGAYTEMKSIISTGKEASIFYGVRDGEEVVLKVYLVETSDFRHMSKYVRGDPRFQAWKNRRQLVYMWAQKEFKNLSRICDKVPCPKPIDVHNNVLVMEFIGEDGVAAPRLKDSRLDDPKKYYNTVVKYIKKMHGERLVHADLSEYNILDWRGKPYVIDLSAGVLLDHPQSMEFLQRDIWNIVNFFTKLGVKADYNKVLKSVLDDN